MGRPSEQRNFGEVGIIPNDIKAVFNEVDIEKTWDYLEKTFRLNKTKWKRLFEEEKLLPSNLSKGERFIIFGKRHLEEPICKLLFRDVGKSQTWIGLIRYIVKDKIAEKKVIDQKSSGSNYQKGSYR
jgi:hypothetical protein